MAGLFELQLPNESRRRRSSDVAAQHHNVTSARSNSPPPEVTARELVTQLVAKQQAASLSPVSSSRIFSWKRRGTGGPEVPRPSFDNSSRTSGDASTRSISQSPDQSPDGKKTSSRHSPRHAATRGDAVLSSPRASSSIDITLTPSTPSAPLQSAAKDEPKTSRSATSALAQAGLGLGLPPVAFPGPSSPPSKPKSGRQVASRRPGTAHGNGDGSSSNSSANVDTVRRVKSFSKHEGLRDIGQHSRPPGKSAGDVLVFSRGPILSPASHASSMPEHSSGSQKGKEREQIFDVVTTPHLETPGLIRGRQATNPPSLRVGDRDKSATRRGSWWPGRRRINSSPTDTQPAPSPPPIPKRSQERPCSSPGRSIPLLPSFRPFSPLMGDFRIADSPRPTASTFEDPGARVLHLLDNTSAGSDRGESVIVRRRHSLTNRTGTSHSNISSVSNHASSHPSSHPHPQLHRYSHSFTSDQDSLALGALLPSVSSPGKPSHPGPTPGSANATTRPRSMTINSPPVSPPAGPRRDAPLLLRQPLTRPNSSAGPPDPFLSGWGINAGIRVTAEPSSEVAALVVDPVDVGPMSTSSGSTSSLSQSASTTNRLLRQRSGTSPPTSRTLTASSTSSSLPPPTSSNRLLRRLSSTFFNSSSTMASPVDPSATGMTYISSMLHSGVGPSPTASNPQSKENLGITDVPRASVDNLKQKSGKTPTKLPDETPDEYLSRLVEAISKAEVAHILAANGDEFHNQALRSYLGRFNFKDDPIDVALRKLLMELGLPRETQQIDRVMEAFAARYVTCNSGLFVDDDHPYILAFSLIMLHTDTFNKSNKNKMTKADYVKNTKLPGIPPEILECFFDNIIFAPFIFIEDPMDTKAFSSDGPPRPNPIAGPLTNSSGVVGNAGSTILGKTNKIDPYYLITQNLLGHLRADVHTQIPKSNPFLYEGTDWPWDIQQLHHLFALAQLVQVQVDAISTTPANSGTNSAVSTPARRKSIALPSLTVGYGAFTGSPPFNSDGLPPPPRASNVTSLQAQGVRTLRIAKTGVLARKEDTTEGGKKSTNRKWRPWSVVLTGTQLLFFRDLNFASHLLGLPPTNGMNGSSPEQGLLNPDEIVSLQECIALFDTDYVKYPNAFRLFMPNGRQFIMQASDEQSLNGWISAINYASAFRSAGVQMRGLGMSHKDVEMTGVAAATSHLQDLRDYSRLTTGPTLVHTYGSPDAPQKTNSPTSPPPSSDSSPRPGTGVKLFRPFSGVPNQVDFEISVSHQLEGAQQFKATFDEVKAELAAHNGDQLQPLIAGRTRTLSMGTRPGIKPSSRPGTASSASKSEDMSHGMSLTSLSRSDTLQSRVDTLDIKINRVQRDLDEELRITRNLAILTPFQRATRDRIQVAVTPLAKKIRAIRIDMARMVCYRFVLLTDLAEEEREWEQAKRDALKAATERLNATDAQRFLENDSSHRRPHRREEQSTTESFYSALNGSKGNQQEMTSTPMSTKSDTDETDFPFLPSAHQSARREDNAMGSPTTPTHPDLGSLPVAGDHERYYTASETAEEIAEAWNETRAAKRVSLVRLPSDVKLSILGRQMKNPIDVEDRRHSNDNNSSSAVYSKS